MHTLSFASLIITSFWGPGRKKKKAKRKAQSSYRHQSFRGSRLQFIAKQCPRRVSGGPEVSPTTQSAQFNILDSHRMISPNAVSLSYLASDRSHRAQSAAGLCHVLSRSLGFVWFSPNVKANAEQKTEERVSRRRRSEEIGRGTQQRCPEANQNVKLKAPRSCCWGSSGIFTHKIK